MANEFKVKNGLIVTGPAQMREGIQLYDADASNYITLTAPTTVSPNLTFTLPDNDGDNGQVLTTNGSGVLSFTTVSGGSSNLNGLTDVTITTSAAGDVLSYDGAEWVNNPAFAATLTAVVTALDPLSRQTDTTDIVPISVGTTAPASPAVGDLWVDTN